MTTAPAARLQRLPRRSRLVLVAVAVVVVAALGTLWLRSATSAQPAPSRWKADATAPPAGTVTVFQVPRTCWPCPRARSNAGTGAAGADPTASAAGALGQPRLAVPPGRRAA